MAKENSTLGYGSISTSTQGNQSLLADYNNARRILEQLEGAGISNGAPPPAAAPAGAREPSATPAPAYITNVTFGGKTRSIGTTSRESSDALGDLLRDLGDAKLRAG